MKKTLQEIMEVLKENQSLDFDYDGTPYYWVHLDEEGNLVESISRAEISFSAQYDEPIEDDSYDWETEKNPKFVEVAQDLLEQVNEYLK